MKKSTYYKLLIISVIVFSIQSMSSCTKCYTCQAYQFDERVDFNKECGTEQEKQDMETDFRKQYPDSLYNVTCN